MKTLNEYLKSYKSDGREIVKIKINKNKKQVLKEISDYVTESHYKLKDIVNLKDFKLITLKNIYPFHYSLADIYVVKTKVLTAENYDYIKKNIYDKKRKKIRLVSDIMIMVVDEYNDLFEKYLKEFYFAFCYKATSPQPSFLFPIGVCKNFAYLGTLNEHTEYDRGMYLKKIIEYKVKTRNGDEL